MGDWRWIEVVCMEGTGRGKRAVMCALLVSPIPVVTGPDATNCASTGKPSVSSASSCMEAAVQGKVHQLTSQDCSISVSYS